MAESSLLTAPVVPNYARVLRDAHCENLRCSMGRFNVRFSALDALLFSKQRAHLDATAAWNVLSASPRVAELSLVTEAVARHQYSDVMPAFLRAYLPYSSLRSQYVDLAQQDDGPFVRVLTKMAKEDVSDDDILTLEKLVTLSPDAKAPRLALALAFLERGCADEAVRQYLIILYQRPYPRYTYWAADTESLRQALYIEPASLNQLPLQFGGRRRP